MAYYKGVTATYTPNAGGVVDIPAFDSDVMCCFIDPGATLATLTINLPTGCQDGQALRIFFANTITLLTVAYVSGIIVGNLTSGLLGSSVVYAYSKVNNKWIKG